MKKRYYRAKETVLDGVHRDRQSVYAYKNTLYKISWGHMIVEHGNKGKLRRNLDVPGVVEAESEEEAVAKLLGPDAELVKVPEHTPESWLPPDERPKK